MQENAEWLRAAAQIDVIRDPDQSGDKNISEVTVRLRDGRSYTWRSPYFNSFFCQMYGIPLSQECDRIFIQHYRGGLFCLSVTDGSLLWRSKSRAVFNHNLVNEDGTLCIAMSERSVVLLDQAADQELKRVRLRSPNGFTILGKDRILVEVPRARWQILDSRAFQVLEEITRKQRDSAEGAAMWKRIFREWNPENEEADDASSDTEI